MRFLGFKLFFEPRLIKSLMKAVRFLPFLSSLVFTFGDVQITGAFIVTQKPIEFG